MGVLLLLPSLLHAAQPATARAVPTFECLGLYWAPIEGANDLTCLVRYRPASDAAWRDGFPLWHDERNREYRGSLLNLKPGTTYEIALALEGTSTETFLTAKTWPEAFPVTRTVVLPSRSEDTLVVDQSGSPDGYVVYSPAPGATATIDAAGRRETCIEAEASHVILRGLTLKNAGMHGIRLMKGAHDVVIEGCDINGWGRIRPDGWGQDCDAAIYSREPTLTRVIVQRNRIHHPRGNANNWTQMRHYTSRDSYHPGGPQAVVFFDSAGNHVIRYNTIWSDDDHHYNDVLGAGANFSTAGFPNCDSDVYGNLLSHCWDDAIESEGANRNVRIWGNYISESYVGIATATTSAGPLYVWRNLTGVLRKAPGPPGPNSESGFLKTSDRLGGGRIYVFHNTILQPLFARDGQETLGARTGLGWGGAMSNVTSRNNVFHLARPGGPCIYDRTRDALASYDYDLYNGRVTALEPYEQHGVQGTPVCRRTPILAGGKADFSLAPGSPGYDAGVRLANFNDDYTGKGPDMGAQEARTPPMEFGVTAYR